MVASASETTESERLIWSLPTGPVIWSERERAAWTPPDPITPTELAIAERILDAKWSGMPGPFTIEMTPYAREILDAFADPDVRRIYYIASRQVSKTTTIENMLAFAARQAPGPALLVLPSESKGVKQFERFKAMFDASPQLAQEKTQYKSDWRKDGIQLRRMLIGLAWAGGGATLKGDPIRYLILDEVAAYAMLKDGHPAEIAIPATNTFHNSKIVFATTPTTSDELAWQGFESSDKCRYWVPCPRCDVYQTLEFNRDTLRWPEDVDDPDQIESNDLASYHCKHCEGEIHHEEKVDILMRGKWVPEKASIDIHTGEVTGKKKTAYRGFQISALYSVWVKFSEVAAAFLRLKRAGLLQTFYNTWLGEPWEDRQISVPETAVEQIVRPYKLRTVPEGVKRVVASADVQWSGGNHLWYGIRGYGAEGESWLLDCGRIDEDLEESDLVKLARYLEGPEWLQETGHVVEICCVDSGDGNRTPEIYDLAIRFPALIRPTVGRDQLESPVLTTAHEKSDGRRKFPGAVMLTKVNTDHYKKRLSGKIGTASGFWIPEDAPVAYQRAIVSEQRVREVQGQTVKYRWKRKVGFGANHYWDMEVYNAAAADLRLFARRIKRDEPAGPQVRERRPNPRRRQRLDRGRR